MLFRASHWLQLVCVMKFYDMAFLWVCLSMHTIILFHSLLSPNISWPHTVYKLALNKIILHQIQITFMNSSVHRLWIIVANQVGDGNVRNQEKTVSVFPTSLQLCLFLTWPKFYCFIVSNYWRATVVISQNDAHVLTTTSKWSKREARPPRDHVNFTYSCISFCLVQLV